MLQPHTRWRSTILDAVGRPLPSIVGMDVASRFGKVVDTISKVAGRKIPIVEAARRSRDVPETVADASRLQTMLRWQAKHDDLEHIVATAYTWEKRLSSG